jgi:succinate dehydrogenase hydrophobic anchor subunit
MKEALATFMIIAVTALIMGLLIFGVAYNSLDLKNSNHEVIIENKFQLDKH